MLAAAIKMLLPPATKLGQGYVFTRVCDSVHRGGVPQCMLGYTPPGADTPPGEDPRGSKPPCEQQPTPRAVHAGDMGNKRAVRILLECILVYFCNCIFMRVRNWIVLF